MAPLIVGSGTRGGARGGTKTNLEELKKTKRKMSREKYIGKTCNSREKCNKKKLKKRKSDRDLLKTLMIRKRTPIAYPTLIYTININTNWEFPTF